MKKVYDNNTKLDWYRVNNDVNGNPRYVTHFADLEAAAGIDTSKSRDVLGDYARLIKAANKAGARKFDNKQFGGGLVIQSYNLASTEKFLIDTIKENYK